MNDLLLYVLIAIIVIIAVYALRDALISILLYAVTAFTITSVVYLLTMALGIYSIFLLTALAIITVMSLRSVIKRKTFSFYEVMPDLPGLFIHVVIFVITSVVLAFFTSWMFWFAMLALMLVIYMNIPRKERTVEVLEEIADASRAIQGKPSWWGTPFYSLVRFKEKLSRDAVRTIYAFSLCALYICTTMIITPYSLPIYTPLIIWIVVLITLIPFVHNEIVDMTTEIVDKLKRKWSR